METQDKTLNGNVPKKAKVIKVTKMEKKDDYGNTSFIVEFDNTDKGYYRCRNEEQKNFVPGIEAEYVIEKRENKARGTTYFTVKLPEKDKPAFKGGKGGYQQPEPRITMISYAMSYVKDLAVAGKIEVKQLPEYFEIVYSEMISKL